MPPEDGTLVVDVRVGADAALALRFRTETAEIIDALCCTPITGRIPVRADLAVQIELAYVGRPAGYPSIQAVPYTLELSLLTGDLQQERGRVQAIVFGDATRTQRLSHARIEVLDGPSVGHVARFDQVTGLYELHDFAPGFVRVRTSAAGFNPVEQELAVATQRPREIVLPRTVTPADSTHELTGMASSFQINVKIEIIDGPLAGVFTLTDEDMGVFVLRSLPPGPMQVRASRGQRSETLTVNISGPSTHVVFHLQ